MITPSQILKEVDEEYSEYLEMMHVDEKFILIRNVLAKKLAFEIAQSDHYRTCFYEELKKSNNRINS